LLVKHVQTNLQPTIEGHSLLGKGPVNVSRDIKYATIGEAVFSLIRAVLVVTQRALTETVFSAWPVLRVCKKQGKISWST
jgi:hypothetical protein